MIGKNWPEKIFAGIADQAGNLATVVNQNKCRRVDNTFNVGQINGGEESSEIDTPERRAARIAGFRIDRRQSHHASAGTTYMMRFQTSPTQLLLQRAVTPWRLQRLLKQPAPLESEIVSCTLI